MTDFSWVLCCHEVIDGTAKKPVFGTSIPLVNWSKWLDGNNSFCGCSNFTYNLHVLLQCTFPRNNCLFSTSAVFRLSSELIQNWKWVHTIASSTVDLLRTASGVSARCCHNLHAVLCIVALSSYWATTRELCTVVLLLVFWTVQIASVF